MKFVMKNLYRLKIVKNIVNKFFICIFRNKEQNLIYLRPLSWCTSTEATAVSYVITYVGTRDKEHNGV